MAIPDKNWALRYCVAVLRAPSSDVIRMTPYTILLTSLSANLIALAQQVIQGGNPVAPRLAVRAFLLGLALAVSIFIGRLARKWHSRSEPASQLHLVLQRADKSIPTYFLLAANAWILLLLIPVFQFVWLSSYNRQTYFLWPFLDKRWIVAGYLVAVGSIFVLPALFKRLSDACKNEPSTWRDFAKSFLATSTTSGTRAQAEPHHWTIRLAVNITKAILAAALAAWFFAPPWQISQVTQVIDDPHEMAHFGGLQAIDRGFLPYVGAASVHFGPGSQLLTYYYMRYTNQFNIIGFRESFALSHWLAATVFMVAVFLRFRLPLAAVIAFLSVNLPPLTLYQLTSAGTFEGFYGWANGFRYGLGALLVLLFLPTVLASETRFRTVFAKGIGLGFVFGLFCYMSQENLTSGILSASLFLAVGWLTHTYTTRQLTQVVTALALGFAIFWAPLLGVYAYHGQLSNFLDLYSLFVRLYSHGYANSTYLNGLQDPWGKSYYFMPILVAALGGLALYRPRLSSSEIRWSPERSTIIAMAIFCLVAHMGAMFRADSAHLQNTMIGLAVLLPCSVVYLPKLISVGGTATRWSYSMNLVVVFVLLLPGGTLQGVDPNLQKVADARKLQWSHRFDAVPPQAEGSSETFRRVGASLIDEPQCCSIISTSMRSMADLMVDLKNLVGERPTYVENVSGLLPGHVYFFADLAPVPIYAEREDMIVNTALLETFLKYFRQDVKNIQCIISDRKGSPEVEIFKEAHPVYRVVQMEFEGRPFYVFLADS